MSETERVDGKQGTFKGMHIIGSMCVRLPDHNTAAGCAGLDMWLILQQLHIYCAAEYEKLALRGCVSGHVASNKYCSQDSRRVIVPAAAPNTFAGLRGCVLRRKCVWMR